MLLESLTPQATLAVYYPLFGGGFQCSVFGLGKVHSDFWKPSTTGWGEWTDCEWMNYCSISRASLFSSWQIYRATVWISARTPDMDPKWLVVCHSAKYSWLLFFWVLRHELLRSCGMQLYCLLALKEHVFHEKWYCGCPPWEVLFSEFLKLCCPWTWKGNRKLKLNV